MASQEANILSSIKHFAERGASRQDLQPFLDKLKKKNSKKLAEKYMLKETLARNTAAAMRSAQKALRVPKATKTRQRRIATKPVRIQPSSDAVEYRRLNKEYKIRTGKWFKRTAQEMRNRMSKLQAIKYRVELMDKGKMAVQEALRKNDPEFQLGGAL